MMICPKCKRELKKVKVISVGYKVLDVDLYKESGVEVFHNCPNCGEYLDNKDFG